MKLKLIFLLISVVVFALITIGIGEANKNQDEVIIITDAREISEVKEIVEFIRGNGGQVSQVFIPQVIIGEIPEGLEQVLLKEYSQRIIGIYRNQVEDLVLSENNLTQAAVRFWNSKFEQKVQVAYVENEPGPILNDARIPPDRKISSSATQTLSQAPPSDIETSEYMYGDILASVILLESNGSLDASTEDWTTTEETNVDNEIANALLWWKARKPSNVNLTFWVYANHYKIPTRYEPINRPQSDQGLWIAEAMDYLDVSSGNYFSRARKYDDAIRDKNEMDWAFTIFVADSSNDADDEFTDGYFAYAYLGGPFLVMTYGNDGYGISNMDVVTAHEMGHVFQALDQYASSECTCTETYGFLNVANQNCENSCLSDVASIMRGGVTPFTNNAIDYYAKGQIGWRDLDDDSINDAIDSTYNGDTDTDGDGIVNHWDNDDDNDNIIDLFDNCLTVVGPSCNKGCPDLTPPRSNISSPANGSRVGGVIMLLSNESDVCKVTSAEYKVDANSWISMNLSNIAANASLNTKVHSDGSHVIYVRGTDEYGNTESTASITIIFDNTPPLLTITSPQNKTYNSNSILANVTLNEEGSWCGRSLDSTTNVTLNGSGNLWYGLMSSVSEGNHTVAFYCNDTAGNKNSTFATFNVDTINPTITISAPVNGSFLVTNYVWLNVTTNENTSCSSAVQPCSTNRVKVNITDTLDEGEAKAYTVGGHAFAVVLDFAGSTTAKFTVNGEVTNSLTEGSTYILADESNLTLLDVTTQDFGGGIRKAKFALSTISDGNPGICSASSGQGSSGSAPYVQNHSWLIGNLAVAESTVDTIWKNLVATCTDAAGNSNSSSVKVYVDTGNPDVNFSAGTPTNGSYQSTSNIKVYVSVVEANTANITFELWNGSLLNRTNTSRIKRLNFPGLADATYLFNVSITDKAGHKSKTETWSVTLDTIIPTVKIIWPINNSILTTNYTWFNLTTNEDATCSYSLQTCETFTFGSSTASGGGGGGGGCSSTTLTTMSVTGGQNHSQLVTGLNDTTSNGWKILNGNCSDAAENSNSSSLKFYVDTTQPAVNFSSNTPANGSFQSKSSILVNVSVLEANEANITFELWNSSLVNRTNATGIRSLNFEGLMDGAYSFNVSVSDKAGNKNRTETWNVTLDTTKPLIEYTLGTLADAASINRNWLYVNVTISELNEKNVAFRLYNAAGLYSEISLLGGNRSANFTNIADGNYTYTVIAMDLAENTNATPNRSVVIDTTAPALYNITAIFVTNDSAIIKWITNENANSTVVYGKTIVYGSLQTDSTYATLHMIKLTGLEQGALYHYKVESSDNLGNSNTSYDYAFITAIAEKLNADFIANHTVSVNASSINASFDIRTNASLNGIKMNITAGKDSPTNASLNISRLKYLDVNVPNELKSVLTSVVLKVYYTDSDLLENNLSESTLAMYWFNESSSIWVKLDSSLDWVYGSGVNSDNNYVWANVSHFSSYGAGGLTADGFYCSSNSQCASNYCSNNVCSTPSSGGDNPPSGSSSGGGGGGGGGGGASQASETVLLQAELAPGDSGTFGFKKFNDLAVYELVTEVSSPASNPAITVKETNLASTVSVPVTEGAGKVYKYLSIVKSGLENVSKTIIKFRINNTWFDKNNVDSSTVKLSRLEGGNWNALPTALLSDDGQFTSYQATTPGFSTFAITGEFGKSSPPQIQEQEASSVSEQTTEAPKETTEEVEEEVTKEESKPNLIGRMFSLITGRAVTGTGNEQPRFKPAALLLIGAIILIVILRVRKVKFGPLYLSWYKQKLRLNKKE